MDQQPSLFDLLSISVQVVDSTEHTLPEDVFPFFLRLTIGALLMLAGIIVCFMVGSIFISQSHALGHLTLTLTQTAKQGYSSPTYPTTLIGQQGIAYTPLHPAGKVQMNGFRYDAKTQGEYIALGTVVVVTDTTGIALTVQALPQ